MKINKLLGSISAFISAAALTAVMAVSVSAKDYPFDLSAAPVIEPWGHYDISMEHYDPTKITPDTQVIVHYSTEHIPNEDGVIIDEAPVELIVQSWSFPDTPMANSTGGVWAKVVPAEYDDYHAVFNYADMVAAYGTSDLSQVDSINIGATGCANLTLSDAVITNCGEKMYIALTDAQRAERYKNLLIGVLVTALVIIISIITIFLIILKRKTNYAYDPTKGKYVRMDHVYKEIPPEKEKKNKDK